MRTMARRPLRAAIAGTGFIGAVHARAIAAAGGVLAGVAASSPERSREAARRLGAETAYESAEALVDDTAVDVVHICTPNHLHADLAERALTAGKHVVCEKPLAIDLDAAQRLAALAAGAPACTAVPFAYRFYPTVREARHRIASGQSGAVHLVHGTYLQDWLLDAEDDNWRVDAELGGVSRAFADIGSHWCDLAEFVTGHRLTRLTRPHDDRRARARARRGPGGVRARRRRRRRPRGDHRGRRRGPVRDRRRGARLGRHQPDLGRPQEPAVARGGRRRRGARLRPGGRRVAVGRPPRRVALIVRRDPASLSPEAARLAVLPAGHPQGYQDCFNLFVADVFAAIETGDRPDGLPGFADGLRAAQITDAVLTSAGERRWVDVAPAEVPS